MIKLGLPGANLLSEILRSASLTYLCVTIGAEGSIMKTVNNSTNAQYCKFGNGHENFIFVYICVIAAL